MGQMAKIFLKFGPISLDEFHNKLDSTDFYLADFRSENPQDHFILSSWKNFSFGFENPSFALTFRIESSDIGDWGMNTPAYFALDNLSIDYNLGLKIPKNEKLSVYPNPTIDILIIEGGEGEFKLCDINGKTILENNYKNSIEIDMSGVTEGFYLLKIENNGIIQTKKILKK
jgi:hypothetical protein